MPWTVALAVGLLAQPVEQPLDLSALLAAHADRFERQLADPDGCRLMISVAEVDASGERAVLRRARWGDQERYFYPASAIKVCAAVAALLDLNRINTERGTGFGVDTALTIGSLFAGDRDRERDPTNLRGGRITVRHAIHKLFAVSDNQAFNDLYEMVGPGPLNEAMRAGGFASCRILHRLSELRPPAEQRWARPIALRFGDDTLERGARECGLLEDNAGLPGLDIGRAHLAGGRRVAAPLSFLHKNSMRLGDLQDLLVALVRPDVDTGKRGFPELSVEQRAFLLDAMARLPREFDNPRYDPARYPDDYVKLFLPGIARVIPRDAIRIYNKVGRAYGFSVDNAYIEDRRTGRGFFLAAVLYTNPNGVLNDDTYAYAQQADPFFADLAEVVAHALWR